MRLVDADELIEIAHRIRLDSRERIEQMIESAPTVDAEPVRHGHNTNHGVRWFRCSECGWGMNDIYMAEESMVKDFDKFPYYCPYCGAKIEEASE